jgi:hypothetical protein
VRRSRTPDLDSSGWSNSRLTYSLQLSWVPFFYREDVEAGDLSRNKMRLPLLALHCS